MTASLQPTRLMWTAFLLVSTALVVLAATPILATAARIVS